MDLHGVVPADVDAALVGALRRGDPAATEQLVEQYGERVYRLALRLVGGPDDAAAVAEDTLLRIAATIQTFTGESTFASWLSRTSAAVAGEKLRARGRSGPDLALDEVLPPIDADGHFVAMDDWTKRIGEQAVDGELRAALSAAIEALPDDYRLVLALHDVEGIASTEIAESLGLGVSTVKARLHRARLFVRKELSDHLAR